MTTPRPRGKRTGALLLLLPVSLILIFLPPVQSYRAAQPGSNAALFHRFRDWSTRHLIYPHTGTLSALNAVERDPRAQFAWRDWDRFSGRGSASFRLRRFAPVGTRGRQTMGHDWSISLGAGTTPPGQSPAEFTLNDDTPDCTNDFIVFPVDVTGSATQPNIVGLNNLYSGTTGGDGPCNRTPSGSDNGVSATVLWSYNINSVSGSVATSPVTSLDGTKIAFVESVAGKPAHFHVLAWKSGEGRNAANLQDVLKPVQITTFTSSAPAAGSGTATDLALGTAAADTDTNSSPFIDYSTDQAYVGNDAGILYRINHAFCPQGGCPAPSLDPTWGTAGAVTVGCGSTLTGPVFDFVTTNVYVGCADGLLYGFSSTGALIRSVAIGNGSSNAEGALGGVVDSPLVDGVNSLVYAVSGTGATPHTGNAVVVQVSTLLRSPCIGSTTACIATVGSGSEFPAHDPDFSNAFYSGAAPSSWILYMGGFNPAGHPRIFGITFDTVATRPATAMTTGTPSDVFTLTTTVGPFSPFTEFLNGTTDLLFFGSVSIPAAKDFNVGSLTITTGFPSGTTATRSEGGGPGAIVVDNNNTTVAQGANIYFGTQSCGTTSGCTNGNSAVKLTQVGLN
jgi:hypothetical protein